MKRLLVVQPYVPAYRVPLFRALRRELSYRNVELILVAGRSQGLLKQRDDDRSEIEADYIASSRSIVIGSKTLNWRNIAPIIRSIDPDVAVLEQAIKNIELYQLMTSSWISKRFQVGMWGQGRTFSTSQNRMERHAKDWVTMRSDWFFAYTQEGGDYVVQRGFDPDRVSVLNNTIDTEGLRTQIRSISVEELSHFCGRYGLTEGHTGLFIGGVDSSKGIEFLVDASRVIAAHDPRFRLVVVGSGSMSDWVKEQRDSGAPIICVGRLEGREKAIALKACDLMLIPEWVGLVAVDSLVAGRPIATTSHSSHSPEFAYLRDHENAFVFEHDVDSYANGVLAILSDRRRLERVSAQAERESHKYSIADMAERFACGVEDWLNS